MKNISGKSEEEFFEKSMLTGGDIFSLTVSRDLTNIDEFLVFCYKRYKENTYLDKFSWIDNIKYIKDKDLIEELNNCLLNEIKNKNFNQVWMAVPEIIEWEDVKGFKISGDSNCYSDIYIEKVIDSLKNDLTKIEQLETKRIRAISNRDDSETAYEWSSYNCIIAEISHKNNEYCLSNGKWYKINKDFSENINSTYEAIDLCNDNLINYNHKDEDKYNEELQKHLSQSILLHKYKITIGGGQGNNIEPCDILWKNKMFFIKKNGGSGLLSHLFNQALVSSQMWLEPNCIKQLKTKMKDNNESINIPDPFNSSNYEIVFGIINKFKDERPKIPFFSKVAIYFTVKSIKRYGYKISLKNINNELII